MGPTELIILGALAFVGLIVFLVRLSAAQAAEAKAAWESWVRQKGFTPHDLPGEKKWYGTVGGGAPEELVGKFRSIFSQPSAKCQKCLTGTVRNRNILIFEYYYVVSTGKSSHTVYHTVVASPVKSTLPYFTIRRQGMWDNLKALFGSQDILIGDEEFDKRYHISCTEEVFMKQMMNHEARAIVSLEPEILWHCFESHIVSSRHIQIAPASVEQQIDAVVKFADHLDRTLR